MHACNRTNLAFMIMTVIMVTFQFGRLYLAIKCLSSVFNIVEALKR